jgi:anthranilate/para-aminobenzoate synthase component I
MKGTAARHPLKARDAQALRQLKDDAKARAENLMIADLMRNDLGRVSEIGSVRVPRLFAVESYPTVHQLISEVRARLLPELSVAGLFSALLPAGSITGAPKRRAMEIIDGLEPFARGIYTGCIGWLKKTRKGEFRGVFSVAIRTAVLNASGQGVLGVGAGIVADSDPEAEYEECLLKARFLRRALRRRGSQAP